MTPRPNPSQADMFATFDEAERVPDGKSPGFPNREVASDQELNDATDQFGKLVDVPLASSPNSPEASRREGVPQPWDGRAPKAKVVLRALEKGPVTTNEMLEIDTHRFACEIHNLRQRGYQIKTEKISVSQARYTLVGRVPMVRVRKGMQDVYYESAHWRSTRRIRLDFDSHRCVRCGETHQLNVHHWQYELFCEAIDDLQTMCVACHEWVHNLPSVKIKFPCWVDEEVFEKLSNLIARMDAA